MRHTRAGSSSSLSADNQAIRQTSKAKSRRINVLRDFFFHGCDTPKTTKSQKKTGNTLKARQINDLLESIRFSITNHYREIERIEGYVTVEKIRNSFLGITTRQQTLLELYKKHNENVQKLIGKSIAKATDEKYDRTCRRLEEFMRKQYNISACSLEKPV